jgi:hypothetical protein
MYTIKILDGFINSLLNINVKWTIYKVEQIKIYPFECIDIYIMGKYKKGQTQTTALILLCNGNSILSVDVSTE